MDVQVRARGKSTGSKAGPVNGKKFTTLAGCYPLHSASCLENLGLALD